MNCSTDNCAVTPITSATAVAVVTGAAGTTSPAVASCGVAAAAVAPKSATAGGPSAAGAFIVSTLAASASRDDAVTAIATCAAITAGGAAWGGAARGAAGAALAAWAAVIAVSPRAAITAVGAKVVAKRGTGATTYPGNTHRRVLLGHLPRICPAAAADHARAWPAIGCDLRGTGDFGDGRRDRPGTAVGAKCAPPEWLTGLIQAPSTRRDFRRGKKPRLRDGDGYTVADRAGRVDQNRRTRGHPFGAVMRQ